MATPDQAADAPVLAPSRPRSWRLVLAIAAMLILAAVVLFSGGYVAVQGLSTRQTTDPAAVRALTEEIISIDIPDSLPPVSASSARLSVKPKQVTYHATNAGRLTLTQIPEQRSGITLFGQHDLNATFAKLQPKGGTSITPTVYDIERTINGKTARFTVGVAPLGNAWIVVGKFQGRGGPTLLEMTVTAPAFSEASVRAVLESIH
jgi:hypothetical protein